MGFDGGRFDVSDRLTADRLNRKTVLVDTGANIAAVVTAPGMLAFCTSSGSGFVVGQMYQRSEDNTAWYPIINGSSGQTLGSKTINVDENMIKDSANNNAGDILVNNGAKFVRKARGAARQVPQMNSGGTDLVFGLLSGGSVAPDFRRPDIMVGTLSSGGLGTLTTGWSAAIGRVTHNVRNTGNKVLVIVTGNVYNSAQNGNTYSGQKYSIFTDGSEESTYTRTMSTHSWEMTPLKRPFCIIISKIGLSAGNHTFDLRVHNGISATPLAMAADEVLVSVIEFGGAD